MYTCMYAYMYVYIYIYIYIYIAELLWVALLSNATCLI